ncbi:MULTISPECIES: hypothetical protein [unclassified Bradyrhizobium]|nr:MULTISPECIES: hypothetical protein [unclassified Bradyrhizobium]MDH2344002.1 hypothetical protein [Bradyrhizobium sp. SSUT77]MDH2350404.1 hypothetical protein [Bradyrhizobium sp. SSUT112]
MVDEDAFRPVIGKVAAVRGSFGTGRQAIEFAGGHFCHFFKPPPEIIE